MTRKASYEAWIDWHGIGGLALGCGVWSATAGVVSPPTVTKSTEQVYFGDHSYKLAFPARAGTDNFTFDGNSSQDFDSGIFAEDTSAEASIQVAPIDFGSTRYSVWIYSDTSFVMEMRVSTDLGASWGHGTLTAGEWTEVYVTRTEDYAVPKGENSIIRLYPTGTADAVTCYVGLIQVVKDYTGADRPEENLTGDRVVDGETIKSGILADRQPPVITYGRDKASDLASVVAGSTDILLNNYSGVYTPPSQLVDYAAQRQLILRIRTDAGTYNNAYVGWTENIELDADPDEKSVSITTIDHMVRALETNVRTELHETIRTGEAIKAILDAANIPYNDEDIDSGATILTWWGFNGKALDGIQAIVASEGPPATYMMNGLGRFSFHDRHHRVRASYGTTPAYTVVGTAAEVEDSNTDFVFLKGSKIERGRTTVLNQVNITSKAVKIADEVSAVWTAPEKRYTWTGYKTFVGAVDGGFIDGEEPIKGRVILAPSDGLDDYEYKVEIGVKAYPTSDHAFPEEPDFIVESGEVFVEDYSTSGTEVVVTLYASGESTIRGLQFRARAVTSEDVTSTVDDSYSQQKYGVLPTDYAAEWASPNDADSVSKWILEHNRSIRPKAEILLLNTSEALLDKIVQSDLGQRIHIKASHWGKDDDFAVEGIRHELKQQGREHRFTLLAQQVEPETASSSAVVRRFDGPAVQFNEAGTGFGFGVFSSAASIGEFVFDSEERGFDVGVFGETGSIQNVPFLLGSSRLDSEDELAY